MHNNAGKDFANNRFSGFSDAEHEAERADYRAAIGRWRRHLGAGRLFVAPYNRIAGDPEGLLDDLSVFLGIRRLGGASKRHVTTRQNVTPGGGVPDALRAAAEEALAPAMASCRELLEEIGTAKIF